MKQVEGGNCYISFPSRMGRGFWRLQPCPRTPWPCPRHTAGTRFVASGMEVGLLLARLPSHPLTGRALQLPKTPAPMDPRVQGPLRLVGTRGNGAHPSQVKDAPRLHPSAPTPGSVAPTLPCLWGPAATAEPGSGSQSRAGQASIGTLGHKAAHGVLGEASYMTHTAESACSSIEGPRRPQLCIPGQSSDPLGPWGSSPSAPIPPGSQPLSPAVPSPLVLTLGVSAGTRSRLLAPSHRLGMLSMVSAPSTGTCIGVAPG